MANLVDSIVVFRILQKLTTPFNKTKAFKLGVIDKKGKVLVKAKDRTKQQKDAYTMLDRLVFNLKRLVSSVPGGAMAIGSYLTALALIKEHVEKTSNKETADLLMEKMEQKNFIPPHLKEYDLSTPEGYMDAFEDAMLESTVSGASFGGAMSGSNTNSAINSTGRAGVDPVMNFNDKKKKRKKNFEKILNNRL